MDLTNKDAVADLKKLCLCDADVLDRQDIQTLQSVILAALAKVLPQD